MGNAESCVCIITPLGALPKFGPCWRAHPPGSQRPQASMRNQWESVPLDVKATASPRKQGQMNKATGKDRQVLMLRM